VNADLATTCIAVKPVADVVAASCADSPCGASDKCRVDAFVKDSFFCVDPAFDAVADGE
jgi:hypothetical protein